MSIFETIPREEYKCPICGKPAVKHVIKEGARYHVTSWSGNGKQCSDKDCEFNHGKGKCDQ